jgi:glycosyltransferase involved in cell wall biosynthesis
MRILILMARFSAWSQQIALGLSEQGYEVHIVDFRENADAALAKSSDGIRDDYEKFTRRVASIHLMGTPPIGKARFLWAAPQLRRLASRTRAQLILTLYGGGFALTAYASGFRPYCLYIVGSDVLGAGRISRRVNRTTLTNAARVFVNGEFLAARTKEQAPRATVMPLLIGVDPRQFEEAAPVSDTVQFVCTRGFGAALYNNDAIIKAIAKMPLSTPDFRVVFTSGGPQLDQCRALADRILSPSIRAQIQFLGGVSYQRLLAELRRSHALLSFAKSDGTATSVLEGMASGLYPILSDIPQNRALIRPGESVGTLVELDDEQGLADVLVDVVQHPQTYVERGRQNRRFIETVASAVVNRSILAREMTCAATDT